MYFNFGKKSKSKSKPSAQSPDVAGLLPSAFGRYLRYGRRSAFGRRYFGTSPRFPQFGSTCGGDGKYGAMTTAFGRRRRRGARKGGRKSRKPSKALMRACRKHGVKCTKSVCGKRKYKSVSLLKKQLRRKKSLRKRKVRRSRKVRKVRRGRKVRRSRKTRRRRTMFGKRRRVSLFGFRI